MMRSTLRATFSNIFVGVNLILIFYLGFMLVLALAYWIWFAMIENGSNEAMVRIVQSIGPQLIIGLTFFYTFQVIILINGKIDFGLSLQDIHCDELKDLVLETAKNLDVIEPDGIFILHTPQAFAYEITTTFQGKRILCIGWPLIRALTRNELKAVIAHELAHFDNRAFLIHHSIWRINQSIDKSRILLSENNVNAFRFPLFAIAGYLKSIQPIYNNLTKNLRYEFEFYCDRRGAEVSGSNSISSALTKVVKLILCFDYYLEHFPSTSLNSFYDDFFNFYLTLLPTTELEETVNQLSKQNSSSSHPSLFSRIQAVKHIPMQLDITNSIIHDENKIRTIQSRVASFYAIAIGNQQNDKKSK